MAQLSEALSSVVSCPAGVVSASLVSSCLLVLVFVLRSVEGALVAQRG